MDIIRRNTDYAIRALVHLAKHHGNGPVSAAVIADEQSFSYQLACKLMQKLTKAGLVESAMGARGGYVLTRPPSGIDLQEVIEVIQGPLSVSKCLLGRDSCCKASACPIRDKLGELQVQMASFLGGTTLGDLVEEKSE
jgi:Rrf2 family iron-sulfur cluster assembly transcriptional regulator